MYYIELNSKIAEEAGEGHSIMSIYNGDLVETPLQQIHTRLYGDRSVLPPEKQDKMIPVSHAYVAERHIPNTELHILDPCGHSPQIERPEEFNNLVLEFLAR